MIEDLYIHRLNTHNDLRGFFREIFRNDSEITKEGFAQLSHSYMQVGIVKAWHLHSIQSDFWYCPIGEILAVCIDLREDSETYKGLVEVYMGERNPVTLKIPPGVAHGLRVLEGPAHLFYLTSQTYDGSDEGRLPYDSLDYDWLREPKIT